ncbi:RNA pseudouridine synthase [Labilibacter sediminis]|nr:RNA pseudouridine synthase [Labilibacter sediminis]
MSHHNIMPEDCFTAFRESIDSISLPQKFTFPFYYKPHPLSLIAAKELQNHLLNQKDWEHDFGIVHYVEGSNIGKMFGVLVVQKTTGEIGYLSAFSGKLAGTNHLPGFVPPIYDLLNKDGFFKIEENNISEINHRIKALKKADDYLLAKNTYQQQIKDSEKELADFKLFMKLEKQQRKDKRNQAKDKLDPSVFNELEEVLKQESLKHQYDFKQLKKHWKELLGNSQKCVDKFAYEIENLKEERKLRSGLLQQKLFNQYQFLNIDLQTKGLNDIFKDTSQKIPPAGAGDCAAPKLLQYAFQHNLKPIAMAEFWWGQSPKSEIRTHGNFYPACRGKCEPILGHMLKGMLVDDNPIQAPTIDDHELKVVFEDEDILLVNKPTEFLSVPGKQTDDSVYSRIKEKYPNATGPLLVHRLDMSTSGLLLIAKNKEAHKVLQSQFINRTVNKRYIAVLDGTIKEDEGLIDLPLRVDLDDRPRQLVCYEHGKPAQTRWKVIERSDDQTRVQFFPLTGRTHQLRVHSAHAQGLNTPIVGDDLYGTMKNRLHLHAEFLEFTHPVTGKKMKIKVKPDF